MKSAAITLAVAILLGLSNAVAIAQSSGRPRIFIADKDGNDVKLLVEIPEAGYHGSPHWSADGKLILMNAMPSNRGYELSRIYACAVRGPFSGNVVEMGVGSYARFSPDMSRISFHVRAGNPDQLQPGIWVMRDDGSDRKRLGEGTRPRWTADGKRLVFVNPRGNSIEIMNADGTEARTLHKESYASVAGPAVSPDGKEACYIAYREGPYEGALYRVPLTDSPAESKEIYRGRLGWDPAWSPDGRQILFWLLTDNGEHHIVAIDADGKLPPQKLANQEGIRLNTDPEWSPDGQRIVFASDRELEKK